MGYSRTARRKLQADNLKQPVTLLKVPKANWPSVQLPPGLREVWRSRDYLVQVWDDPQNGFERITMSRTFFDPKMDSWGGTLSWEEMQRLKAECGRADKTAVEVYPADCDVVNVANMRHIWILEVPPPFVWKKRHTPTPDPEGQQT